MAVTPGIPPAGTHNCTTWVTRRSRDIHCVHVQQGAARRRHVAKRPARHRQAPHTLAGCNSLAPSSPRNHSRSLDKGGGVMYIAQQRKVHTSTSHLSCCSRDPMFSEKQDPISSIPSSIPSCSPEAGTLISVRKEEAKGCDGLRGPTGAGGEAKLYHWPGRGPSAGGVTRAQGPVGGRGAA